MENKRTLQQPGSRLQQPGSRVPAPTRTGPPGSRLPAPSSRLPTSSSRLPAPASKLPNPSQGNVQAPKKQGISSSRIKAQSNTTTSKTKSSGIFRPSSGKESLLKRFDRTVDAELKRRRDTKNVLCDAVTSDVDLLEAVDSLVKAETQHSFRAAVKVAEKAAAKAPPDQAEEAAVKRVKGFQAQILDVVGHDVPGIKPIQVIGYVGITRPGKPFH